MKNENTIKATSERDGQFSRRIGSTTYLVSVHFSKTGKETIEDKIMRLIENEVGKSA